MTDELPILRAVSDKETGQETETLLLFPHEHEYIKTLIAIIHSLRKRDEINARDLHSLAILLRALERLPMVTDGMSIEVSLVNINANGGSGYCLIYLCGEYLELAIGESIDSGVGCDHQVLSNLQIGLEWRRHDEIETRWDDWLDEFAYRANDDEIIVRIEDNDSDIDWNASASGAEFWADMPENEFLQHD